MYIIANPTNGTIYVYEVVKNDWDKEKKQARSKQVCIGKRYPVTGELIPSKRLGEHAAPAFEPVVTARTSVTGPALLLRKMDEDLGLSNQLKKASPEHWQEILSLAWYILAANSALSDAKVWYQNHEVPSDKELSSEGISELLAAISEEERQTFLALWGKSIAGRDYLCYDITSVSSYAEQNEYVRRGCNGDGEKLPKIHLGMVYGLQSMLSWESVYGALTCISTLTRSGWPKTGWNSTRSWRSIIRK